MAGRTARLLCRRSVFVSYGLLCFVSLLGCSQMQASQDLPEPPPSQRADVPYQAIYSTGTIVVDPTKHYLYLVMGGGHALRYPVGVGAQGYAWSGTAVVRQKREWPNWYPTDSYVKSRPEVGDSIQALEHGRGVLASPDNPLGARALYLWQNGKDTLYRIHGTNEPWTVGHDVSAGCIRLTNTDIIDLYDRVDIGATVVVLPPRAAG